MTTEMWGSDLAGLPDRRSWMRVAANGANGLNVQLGGMTTVASSTLNSNHQGYAFMANGTAQEMLFLGSSSNPETGVPLGALALSFNTSYRFTISADFINGANADQVTYSIFSSSNTLLASATIGSWETFYSNGGVDALQFTTRSNVNGNGPMAYIDNLSYSVSTIPAPGAIALLGLAGLVGARRRRN